MICEIIGRNYWDRQLPDSAFLYLQKGLDLATKSRNEKMISCLNLQLAVVYVHQNQCEKAKNCLDAYSKTADSVEMNTYHIILAAYYSKIGRKDSAAVYYKNSFCSDNIYAKLDAFTFLGKYYAEQGQVKNAEYYYGQADSLKSYIAKIHKTEQLVFKQYNHIYLAKDHSSRYVLLALFLMVAGVWAYIVWRRIMIKKRQNRAADIASLPQKIPSKLLEIVNGKTGEVVHLTETDWGVLVSCVEKDSPGFKKKLLSSCKVTEQEYHVCILIKLNVPVRKISELIYVSPAAISNIRKRLIEKVKGSSGSAKECDAWLRSL